YQYRTPIYSNEIAKLAKNWPDINLKREHSFDLVEILTLLEQIKTKEGLKQLGLRESEISSDVSIVNLLQSRGEARLTIVESMRERMKSIASMDQEKYDYATQKLYEGL